MVIFVSYETFDETNFYVAIAQLWRKVMWSIVYSKNLKVENNKIWIFNNKSNKNIFFPKYTFTVGERGNPHLPDS